MKEPVKVMRNFVTLDWGKSEPNEPCHELGCYRTII